MIGLGVLFVADPDARDFEQLDNGRKDLFPGKSRLGKVLSNPGPDFRQGFAKKHHAIVFVFVANAAPFGMVAVLLAAPRVIPGRLEMTIGVRADPDVLISRRNTD